MHVTPAGGPHERSFAIGWRASKQCWGVTAGNPRHNSSNVRDVTAGNMGRNSSGNNIMYTTIRTKEGELSSFHDCFLTESVGLSGAYLVAELDAVELICVLE